MASGSGSTQSTMARKVERPSNDELGGAPKKKVCKEGGLELDVFNNPMLRAHAGWKNVPQPWSVETVME